MLPRKNILQRIIDFFSESIEVENKSRKTKSSLIKTEVIEYFTPIEKLIDKLEDEYFDGKLSAVSLRSYQKQQETLRRISKDKELPRYLELEAIICKLQNQISYADEYISQAYFMLGNNQEFVSSTAKEWMQRKEVNDSDVKLSIGPLFDNPVVEVPNPKPELNLQNKSIPEVKSATEEFNVQPDFTPTIKFINSWNLQFNGKRLTPGSYWWNLRQKAFERDGYKCVRCGSNNHLTLDHIVELSIGGTSELDNLQTLCGECHEKKQGRKFLNRNFDANDNYGKQTKVSSKAKTINEAINKHSRVQIKYSDVHGVRSFRVIHPLQIRRLNRSTYTQAFCDLDNDVRIFRLSRMQIIKDAQKNYYIDKPITPVNYEHADRFNQLFSK